MKDIVEGIAVGVAVEQAAAQEYSDALRRADHSVPVLALYMAWVAWERRASGKGGVA